MPATPTPRWLRTRHRTQPDGFRAPAAAVDHHLGAGREPGRADSAAADASRAIRTARLADRARRTAKDRWAGSAGNGDGFGSGKFK